MTWDPIWDSVFSRQPWGKYPGEDLIRFVARNFYRAPDRSAVRVLEIGCGPGANLWYLAREGFHAVGIDGAASAIEIARERLDREVPGWKGSLHVGDIGALPFDDRVFDAVIDNEAVYCNSWDDSVRIYRDTHRVLKPQGRLFVRTFAVGTWGDGTGKPLGRRAWACAEGPLEGKGFARFTAPADLPDLLGKDFEIDSIEEIERTLGNRAHRVRELVVSAIRL